MIRWSAGLAAMAVGLSVAVPGWADDLDDRRTQVKQQLTAAQRKADADSKALANASSQLMHSRGQLAQAQSDLAETRRKLKQAEAEDEAAAQRLAQAQNDLELAKAAVSAGERNVAEQQAEVGKVARTQYQQRTGMVGIGLVVTGADTGDINNRVQWSTTVFDATQSEMDQLRAIQRLLVAAQERQQQIERQMADERARAAANLTRRQQLAAEAAQQERAVAALVQANAVAEAEAGQNLEASQAQAASLQSEQSDVEGRISARMARQRAEESRRIEADRQARENADTARSREEIASARSKAEAEAARAGTQAPAPAPAPPAPEAARPGSPFMKPVDGEVTSRYGMRLHPVLRVWKLHDGTDYGVGCGVPMRAAADGVVAERYYNGGYGNRLMIDHGRINGQYLTTGYNHASSYTVDVGQRVRKGDVIGYVGSTGYSTGCHLHLMVWADGRVTNPQNWF